MAAREEEKRIFAPSSQNSRALSARLDSVSFHLISRILIVWNGIGWYWMGDCMGDYMRFDEIGWDWLVLDGRLDGRLYKI